MVYQPREDSQLLATFVRKHAHGHVIDIGTGTGVQAQAAKSSAGVKSVEAVDIDEQALAHARDAGVQAHKSDKFSDTKRDTYDTIICNAPYLPDEPLAPDVALDGGPNGYEWTIDFLAQARNHLGRDGQILLLISTLTNEHVIKQWLREHALEWQVLAREKHSFEELLCYRIVWALPEHPDAQYLASGKRSRVYRIGADVLKRAQPRRVAQEVQMLKKANKLGLGPAYKDHGDDWVRMEYVPGERIEQYAQHASTQEFQDVLALLKDQARTLDQAGIDKQEMTNPYKHVLVDHGSVVMIDWERAKPTPRPHNSAQLQEYIKKLKRAFPHHFP